MWHKTDTQTEMIREYIKCNQKDFYRLAYSYMRNNEDALDVVQEAAYKALVSADSLKNKESLKPWFYRILVNESFNLLRKRKKMVFNETLLEELTYEDKDVALSMSLYNAILQLDPDLKTIIILRYFEDMKIQDIAIVTETNLSTLKSRLYKALDILKSLIGSEEDE